MKTATRRSFLFLCLSFIGHNPALAAQAAPAADTKYDSANAPGNLLIRSYLASQKLLPEERAMVLLQLSLNAAKIEPSYDRLWSQELFSLAFELPRNWNRLAFEKNALETLSQVDPVLALQLFGEMDDPIPTDAGAFPEDTRAFAAQAVFAAYWRQRGPAGLEEILSHARHLGDTGQYPYLAMIPIVLTLAKTSPNYSEEIVNNAATYFSRGSRFESANPDFVQFLNSVWDAMPAPLKHQALQVAVQQLTEPRAPDIDVSFKGDSHTNTKAMEFRDRNKQILFELLPRIREVDEQWAKRLVDVDSSLAAAMDSGGIQSSQSATIQGVSSASPAQLTAAQARAAQQRTLSQVEQQAPNDPDAALLASRSLSDPALQAIALANIAAGFAKKDPAKASNFVSQANSITDTLKDNPGKVMALFAIAKANRQLNYQKAMEASWNQAFSLGQELFQEDLEIHPVRPAYQATCYEALLGLAEFGGKFDPPMVLQGLQTLRNQLLQAYLPISAAGGIFQHDQALPSDAPAH